MTRVFHNRSEELGFLERLWTSGRAELLVMYGRRRVGKTELLAHVARSRRAIYLEATDVREELQLVDAGAAIADGLGLDRVLAPAPSNWGDVLAAVEAACAGGRTFVVLDEFQHIAKQSQGVGSVLSRWWRETGRHLDLVLVLAGSDIAFFADEVLGSSAALHGRRTADWHLRPFSYRHAPLFVPSWSAEDRVRAYAIWGGVPYYLDFLDDAASLEENLVATVFAPGAPLAREADYLIRMESRLRDVALYGSLLRSIAAGDTRPSQLATRLHVDLANVQKGLDRLESVGLVRRVRPIVRARARDAILQVADPFLRFWFRYVAPAGMRLSTEASARDYAAWVMSKLDEYTSSPAFEEICQAHLADAVGAASVGYWWGSVREARDDGRPHDVRRELDGVAIDHEGAVIAVATCKWTNAPVAYRELEQARRLAAHLQPDQPVPVYVYARNGVDARIADAARESDFVRVVTLDDLHA